MTGTVRDARRKLHSLARNGGNWRLKGMFLAELPKTEFDGKTLARAWPTTKSEYRFLGSEYDDHQFYSPDRTILIEEDSTAHRQLSDVTKESDWDSAGDEMESIHADRLIKRALAFGSTSEELDTLWREQLMDTVIEGSRKAQIARDAATVINVETTSGNHPRGADDRFAREVAQGGAIRDDGEDYDNDVAWDTTKFGEGARATDELIDHSLIDYIEQQVEWIGRQCENALNRQWLTELVDNASTTVDASGEDNRGWATINEGIHQVELNDFTPDSVVVHPTFFKTMLDTAESNTLIPFANEFGDDSGIRDRMVFPLLGLEGFRGSAGVYDPDGSSTWDYTGADETGAVVYDSDLIGLYMYRDIEIKDYEDPIRDLEGVNARIQTDAQYHQPDSAAALDYSTS